MYPYRSTLPNNKLITLINDAKNVLNRRYQIIDISKTEEALLLTFEKYPGRIWKSSNIAGEKSKICNHEKFFTEVLPRRINKLCRSKKYVLALNFFVYCHKMTLVEYFSNNDIWTIMHDWKDEKSANENSTNPEKLPHTDILYHKTVDMLVKIYCGLGEGECINYIYNSVRGGLQNSDALELIIKYHLENNNFDKASTVLNDLKRLDQNIKYIKEAEAEIKRAKGIQSLKGKSIDFNKLGELDGISFEKLVLEQFLELGFSAKTTPATGDFGADIIVTTEDETVIAIQCKRFSKKVNLKAVQEVVGSLA